MRILFVTNSLGVGGIETNLVRLTRELVARGHTVTVAAHPGELSAAIEKAGGETLPLEMSFRRPAAVIDDVRRLSRVLDRCEPDVVHVFSAGSAVPTAVARTLRRLRGRPAPPVVASVMGLHGSPSERDVAVRVRVLLTALGARRVVVMAPAIDAVVRSLPIPSSRLAHQSVVGVDLPSSDEGIGDRARIRAELQLAADQRLVTTIGRLEPRKSHELFVQAAGVVAKRRQDTVFVIAGDGDEEGRLRAEIDRLGLEGAVRLLGHRGDVDALLRASDVCVRPGVVEGFIGITVLEAQALGVPVVSFETEDVRLAVTHEETGLLVPRGDVAGLAAAVCRLLDDPELVARLTRQGRAHVEREYSLPAVATRLEQLYGEVLAGSAVR
jgi:glycosyltransferase involved in cell wall biosynthesis